jgi:UDP-2,4-diacetamido-2,4,6-trideoxy-beta-L-altropyranose hydrolase
MMAHRGPLRVLFRVAAGPRTGFGHLVRAASLGRAFGVEPRFSIRGPQSARVAARRLGGRVLEHGAAGALLRRDSPDVLVIDDRVASATRPWRRAARRLGIPIVSVHDLAIGPGDSDLVVDGSLGAERLWVTGVPALLGPRFSILNPQLVEVRRASRIADAAPHVVIALGGGPRRQAAGRLASAVIGRRPDATVSVAGGFVGSGQPSGRARICWLPPSALGASLASATVAVVGGGVTLYEEAALGVPTMALAVVASQRPTVEAFAAHGAALDGGLLRSGRGRNEHLDSVSRQVSGLLTDAVTRRRLSRAASAVVDGRGASRVASAIRGLLEAREGRRAAR